MEERKFTCLFYFYYLHTMVKFDGVLYECHRENVRALVHIECRTIKGCSGSGSSSINIFEVRIRLNIREPHDKTQSPVRRHRGWSDFILLRRQGFLSALSESLRNLLFQAGIAIVPPLSATQSLYFLKIQYCGLSRGPSFPYLGKELF